MNTQTLSQGIEFLTQRGLNLFAALDCATLPAEITQSLREQGIPLEEYLRLVLTGHGGRQLWTALTEFGWETEHPVDYYSRVTTETFIKEYLGNPTYLRLYPTDYSVPLQRLGELAGWSHPSPLGLGINETYGVWFAYRTAFLTNAELPVIEQQPGASPCDSCADKPCISTCPAKAVGSIGAFDINRCVTFRVPDESICRDRCLARMACPVAPEHRYRLEQIQYHYGRSLETIKLYMR